MSKLTHLNQSGEAQMVDISGKAITKRRAVAFAQIKMSEKTLQAIQEGNNKKGDVLGVARLAGIMAAKKTSDLIPLCHPLPLSLIEIHFTSTTNAIEITATAETTFQTGVEMEALTAASIAALTIYDMAKALDKNMVIEQTRLLEKTKT